MHFDVLWRYFAWSNQTLSVFTFWAITIWLSLRCRRDKLPRMEVLIALIPALWMTAICTSYILIAPEGFSLDHDFAYAITCVVVLSFLGGFITWFKKI